MVASEEGKWRWGGRWEAALVLNKELFDFLHWYISNFFKNKNLEEKATDQERPKKKKKRRL